MSHVGQWLYDWQTLIGGVLAIIAAVAGSILLHKQIRQAEALHQAELRRKHTAAKLTMPLALSGVNDAVQQIADEVAGELEAYGPDGVERTLDAILADKGSRKRFVQIVVPTDVIGTFERFVETLTESQDIKHVSELVAKLQILISRFNSLELQSVGARAGLESLLIDAAAVKLLNDKMFNYARSLDDGPFGYVGARSDEETWQEIQGTAQSLVFKRDSPDLFFPAINRLTAEGMRAGSSPWLEKFS